MTIRTLQLGSLLRAPAPIAIAMMASLVLGTAATAQPCNPVIDGTYCAEQMPKRSRSKATPRASANMPPMRNIGRDASPSQESPATFGGITFGNTGENCVGFMRRGKCR